jgi:hypothetical protein
MPRLVAELNAQFAESAKLEQAIRKIWRVLAMSPETLQKETMAPARSRRVEEGHPECKEEPRQHTPNPSERFSKNLDIRFDLCRFPNQLFESKPAGPLSQDMLSLGGSFFFRREVFP